MTSIRTTPCSTLKSGNSVTGDLLIIGKAGYVFQIRPASHRIFLAFEESSRNNRTRDKIRNMKIEPKQRFKAGAKWVTDEVSVVIKRYKR